MEVDTGSCSPALDATDNADAESDTESDAESDTESDTTIVFQSKIIY